MTEHHHFIIISGYNLRSIIAFCRFLHKYDYHFSIIAKSKYDPILHTNYKSHVGAIRRNKLPCIEEFLEIINTIKCKHKIENFIIAPTSEYLNQFLLSNSRIFQTNGCMIPLVRNDIYNKITNKQSFLDLCKEQQIKTPERYSYIPESFPFVAKPKHNITENGKSLYPHIINNSVELRYFERNENENDFFYEEFIEGKSFYLLFYISRNGHSECFSQENLIQQDKGKSIIFAVASRIHKYKISDHFITLFRKIHFHGIVMVELRSRDGHYYAIEANPRFWGPSQLIIDQQWTIFRHFIEDFTGQSSSKVQCPSSKPRYYLWLNGFIDGIINARKTAYFGLKKRILLKMLLNIMCDIYLKHDTICLFLFELSHIIKNRIVYGNR